jgi:hypothetical protein
MSHFIAYPVTPDMGFRESINAMLSHVAFDQNMGYRADTIHAANYLGLLRDFDTLVEAVTEYHTDILKLVGHVPGTYASEQPSGYLPMGGTPLAHLVEVLVALCNDYPLYDDQDHSNIEQERLMEAVTEAMRLDDNIPDGMHDYQIAEALFEVGAAEHESDGGVYISETDWDAAVAYVPAMLVDRAKYRV